MCRYENGEALMTDDNVAAERPAFVVADYFLETAFEVRFQGLLRQAWRERSWHVIAALPGSGKSLGIADMTHQSTVYKDSRRATHFPLLAIRAPKNGGTDLALGTAFCSIFGIVPSMPWYIRRAWLVQVMAEAGVECIIIDDSQDLNLRHLAFLKELTDNLAAPPYERLLGLGLVAAHGNNDVPFRETFARPETLWQQFHWRLDTQDPYIIVPGHTEEELRLILATFEDLYRDQLPDLHLHRWTRSIFTWLTNPLLDPDATGRVLMGNVTKFVTLALRRAYEREETDVDATLLGEVADLMT